MSRLTQIIGAMGGGKTTLLTQDYVMQKTLFPEEEIALIKHISDARYDTTGEHVCTHDGSVKVKADFNVSSLSEVPEIHKYKHLFIDEAHFYPDLVDTVINLLETTTCNISLTSLNGKAKNSDGVRDTFDCVTKLLPYTTEFLVMRSKCAKCGERTLLTEITEFGKEQNSRGIYVGGFDMYVPMCTKCINSQ